MSKVIKVLHRSRYAPLRYEATRPFAARLGRFFVSQAMGRPFEQRAKFLMAELMPLVRSEVARLGNPDGPGPSQAEMDNIQIYGGYQASGRIIFDVRKELSRALLMTDAQDVPCGALVFPCDAFYLHFGVGTGLFDNGLEIEGVFVQYLPSFATEPPRMLVSLVPIGRFSARNFWTLPMGEPLTGISINLAMPEQSLSEALEAAIQHIIEHNKAILAQYADMERMLSAQYGQVVKVPTPIDDLEDKRDLLLRALQLTTNTLFYLAAEPEDVCEGWDLDAPNTLLQQASSDKFGTRKMAENTLSNSGYIKVRYVGGQYANSTNAHELEAAMSSNRTVQTHFRRGHFRRQPYGPERAMRKTVFIAPVVVNAGHGDMPGRIYDVQRDENSK